MINIRKFCRFVFETLCVKFPNVVDAKGWLAFDVFEEEKANEIKLMKLYSNRYNAFRYRKTTTMVIPPEGGEKLINEFLN